MMSIKNAQDNKNKIIEKLKAGMTISEISRQLFKTNSTAKINALIDSYGLCPDQYNTIYRYMNREWLQQRLNELKTPSKVAEVYNMSRTSVTRYAQRFGLYSSKFTRTAKNIINEQYFEEINNAAKAYWLGFIMADGNVYHYKDNDKVQFEVKIQQSDMQLLENFANDINFPTNKIHIRTAIRQGTECHSASIRSYNKSFCESLVKHGIVDNKTGKEIFPKTIPTEFKKDFVRGFWDGDGSVHPMKISVCSLSFSIISSLSQWFCHLSIHYTVEQQKNGIYVIKISHKSWKDFLDIVYYPGCLGLQRKVQMANNIRSILIKDE